MVLVSGAVHVLVAFPAKEHLRREEKGVLDLARERRVQMLHAAVAIALLLVLLPPTSLPRPLVPCICTYSVGFVCFGICWHFGATTQSHKVSCLAPRCVHAPPQTALENQNEGTDFYLFSPRLHLFEARNQRQRFLHPFRLSDACRWFEEAGDGAGGWDIQKITNRIGDSDCHVVNEDNVMELNLVDIVGKTTKQSDQPSSSSPSSPERGGDWSDSPQGRGSTETSK